MQTVTLFAAAISLLSLPLGSARSTPAPSIYQIKVWGVNASPKKMPTSLDLQTRMRDFQLRGLEKEAAANTTEDLLTHLRKTNPHLTFKLAQPMHEVTSEADMPEHFDLGAATQMDLMVVKAGRGEVIAKQAAQNPANAKWYRDFMRPRALLDFAYKSKYEESHGNAGVLPGALIFPKNGISYGTKTQGSGMEVKDGLILVVSVTKK